MAKPLGEDYIAIKAQQATRHLVGVRAVLQARQKWKGICMASCLPQSSRSLKVTAAWVGGRTF